MGEEDVPWEQWWVYSFLLPMLPLIQVEIHRVINAELRQPKNDRGMSAITFSRTPYLTFPHLLIPDRQAFNAMLASSLTNTIHTMLTHTSSERGRSAVPLITNAAGISPFPIKVTVKVGDVEVG